MALDDTWVDAVIAVCDPVFLSADVAFEWQVCRDSGGGVALLWEPDPVAFDARYPDSGVVESYGDQWPPPCLDYWVKLDEVPDSAVLTFEGWDLADRLVPLTGDAAVDGPAIAAVFAEVFRVPFSPR